MKTRRKPYQGTISATGLAELGKCERSIVLKARREKRGGRPSISREAITRMKRGERIHESADASMKAWSRQKNGGGRSPCFVASELYGLNDPRTERLREYRDKVLMASWKGRVCISLYYRFSPYAVEAARCSMKVRKLLKWFVDRKIRKLSGRGMR